MGLGAWVAKANIHWGQAFSGCELQDHGCVGRIWRRIRGRHGGTWLHGAWYCAPQCLEHALRQRFASAHLPMFPRPPAPHRIPLGLLMLSRGQLTNPQLRSALEAQRTSGRGQIGYWLEELGFATEPQVTAALGLQWACPVLPSFAASDSRCAAMLPFRLLEKFRMLPVQFAASTRDLYLAFSQGVDYVALYAIERILDCRTEACLLSQSTMDRVLERIGHERHPSEMLFESSRDAAEMARITCGYVLKLSAREVRIAVCGAYVWVGLESGQGHTHLLFLRPNPAEELAPVSTNPSGRKPPANTTKRN